VKGETDSHSCRLFLAVGAFAKIGQDRAAAMADLDCILQRRDHLPASSDGLDGFPSSHRIHEPREPAHNEVNAHDGSNGPR
jgi:hypothetical protein